MVNSGKILVTGATGNVGGAVVAKLVATGSDVRALVRDESKAQTLRKASVEAVIGDLERLETLDGAFSGVSKAFLATPVSSDQVTLASNGIAAAKKNGALHIVRLSATAAHDSPVSRIGGQQVETEAELKASGLPYTILRPHFFMQNILMAAQTVASDGVVYMPFKDGKVGMIDVRDIAEVAVKALTEGGHEGKTYTLTGPMSISFHEVALYLSEALGREVRYVDVPPETARVAFLGVGLPEFVVDGYIELFEDFTKGVGDYGTEDFEQVMGHPARSYETFVRDFAQVFGGTFTQAA